MIAIQSLISLAALLFLLLVLFNGYREDRLRQELFELRDRLFDEAVEGNVSFDSHAYQATRLLLNGMLRFAHRLSLSRFVIAVPLINPDRIRHAGAAFDAAFSSSSAADRALCMGYVDQANRLFAKHLMTSPFFFVVLIPLVSTLLAKAGFDLAAMSVKRLALPFRNFDRVAFAEGCK